MTDFPRLRQELWDLLGDLPDRKRPITAQKISESEDRGCICEKLVLDLNGLEPVPAYFVRPKHLRSQAPAVLYHHAHGGDYALGKEELLRGRPELQRPPYAEAITGLGWSGLCIDAWAFGERHHRTESSLFKEMLWNGRVLWGMMVYDAVRALDYLAARPEVALGKIATIGLSMGSTMAWWLAALDERICVCADICCLTDFEALIEDGGLDRHGLYYFVPGLLKRFSASRINELIAPRPHLSLAGLRDSLTPERGLRRIDRRLRQVYGQMGASEAWKLSAYDCGHLETAEMRSEILLWLKRWLG